jgi:hypothetical protein
VAQRFLAPKLSPDASESQNSLLNSLIAGKSSGDGRDQHCNASQAVLFLENFLSSMRKARQMRAFLIANSLWRPTFELFGPRIPKSLQPNPRKLPFSGDSPWSRLTLRRPRRFFRARILASSRSKQSCPAQGLPALPPGRGASEACCGHDPQ